MSRVIDNFLKVKDEVTAACVAAGRPESDVKLLVVSKTIPVPVLMELYDFGVREFAENREPELTMKREVMPDDIIWHFIGPVQSNKIRKIVRQADVVHSVESLSQLQKFERIAGEEKRNPRVLLEVNVSGELSKGGIAPEDLFQLVRCASECNNVHVCGMMTMAPFEAETAELTAIFSRLRELRDEAGQLYEIPLPVLSMGMSGDFPAAIACGSTIVRIGSRIFEGIERISR